MEIPSVKLPNYVVESTFHRDPFTTMNQQQLIPKGISSSAFQRAWNENYTGKNIIIAVMDTGVDNHKDLSGKIIKSIDLTGESISEPHGTHVAGTIAANGWIIGGAPDSLLIDVKTLGKYGGTVDNIVKGIELAVANNATIINMSLGGSCFSSSDINRLTTVIDKAWNHGCICIAAAGNEGKSINTPDPYSYPASVDKAESIAACDVDECLNNISLAQFSNENDEVSLSACGKNVLSTVLNNDYAVFSGTSMATPHVSAMAACLAQSIKDKHPNIKGSEFSSMLVSSLHDNVLPIGDCSSKNISYGLGYLRYQSMNGPYLPNGKSMYSNGAFVGHLIIQ